MTPNRPIKFRSSSDAASRLRLNRSTSYSRRPVESSRSRSIDGVGVQRKIIIPATQDEYLDSLRGAPPKLSRFARVDDNNEFDIQLDKVLSSFRKRILKTKTFLPAAGLGLILLVSIIGLVGARAGKHAEADRSHSRASIEAVIDTDSEISERRPTNMQGYKVAGDLPRMLYIEDMGLSARVRRVGVGTDTEIRLPSNIFDVGWYESSVKPGENGAVVLTGHAMGPTKPGIFHDLTELEPGDELKLETGEGSVYIYYIAKLEAFDATSPLEPQLAPAVPGSAGLNLITETGHYDSKSNTFDQRLVVYAVQKSVASTPAQ